MPAADTGSSHPSPADASGDRPRADPRDRAIRRLARQSRHFPELRIGSVDDAGLGPRDAGLARAIDEGVARRWLTIEHVLGGLSGRSPGALEPKMRAVLLAGSFQLLFLDRVPDHAVLDESVTWAKANIRPKAGGFVNAILRKVASARTGRRDEWTVAPDEFPLPEGGALVLSGPALPNDGTARLAVATGVPEELVSRWADASGADRAHDVALHSIARAPTIVHTAHAREPIENELIAPHTDPGHGVFAGSHAELESLLAERTDVWVQDPASSGAVASAADLPARTVVDFCAGRGTKTRQLAATFPGARIVATDPDAERYAELRRAFQGHGRVEVMPPARVRNACLASADLVLLDVPCSNTGVLARRPEARHRAGPRALARLTEIQRQIIADAIPLLTDSGAILYATCSLEREENEGQAAWASEWHGFAPGRERRVWPRGGPGAPSSEHSDGAYSVLLRR